MKKSNYFLKVLLLISLLSLTNLNIYAQDYEDITETEDINNNTDEEKLTAGDIINSVIDIINNAYIGSEVNEESLIQGAITGMTEKLDDYSTFYTIDEYNQFMQSISSEIYTTGLMYQKFENSYPLVISVEKDSPAQKAGFKVNDEIIAINGKDTYEMTIPDINEMIVSDEDTGANITLRRSDKDFDTVLNMEKKRIKTVIRQELKELVKVNKNDDIRNIGYVKITNIADDTAAEFKDEIKQMQHDGINRIILDLRGNGGGIVEQALEICNLIVPEGVIVYTKDKEGNVKEEVSKLKIKPFKKIVVLTDSMTASAAEIIASALQDSGAATIVGTRTYGKGAIQSLIPIPDLGVLKLTTMEYYTRNGKKINKTGIMPDVKVEVTLFISEDDTIESDKVKSALEYLGYNISDKDEIIKSISKFQKRQGITLTHELDKKTINALNLAIYQQMIDNDKILQEGYKQIVK